MAVSGAALRSGAGAALKPGSGGVEGVRRARGSRRATATARAEELDLREVVVGKDEPRG